jgi:D-beta-D-heptose 7-phosphate kinase/D-beta-D-heptose 1-phosphate adenosyltransferase
MNKINNLINMFDQAKILLVGDIMLDRFIYGAVSRISPEAPIPVVKANKEKKMLGGAGNVLANLSALGCKTDIISLIGDDAQGQEVMQYVSGCGASIHHLIEDPSRPTILKTRYISQNQQLLRVDQEDLEPVHDKVEKQIIKKAEELITQADILILSDYGKGLLTADVVKMLIKIATKNKVPVIVDPKGKDFSKYKGASIITPNRNELSEATRGMEVKTDADIEQAAQNIIKQSGIDCVIVTRSEDGISVVNKKDKPLHFPTKAREVYDVSGAGDTVIAVLAAAIAKGGNFQEAAQIANSAGGLAVAKLGTAIISRHELLRAIDTVDEVPFDIAPLMDWETAKAQIEKWQARGLKVGFTNGCFDILHYGHVNYLAQAKQKCDRLVMGLNHDQSVKILKGPDRPINDEMARSAVVGALSSTDMVVLFGATEEGQDNTPSALLDHIRPDILMKGGDYTVDQLPEGKVVKAYGGEVEIMPLYDGYSTTNIIDKSRA